MVKSNFFYEIFIAVTAFVDPSLNVHERIHCIMVVVSSFNCNIYIFSLDSVVKICQDLSVSEVPLAKWYGPRFLTSGLWVRFPPSGPAQY
jgi:hypothetical protein